MLKQPAINPMLSWKYPFCLGLFICVECELSDKIDIF